MGIIGEQLKNFKRKKQDLNDACKKGNDDMANAKQKFFDNTKHKSVLENTVDDLEMNLHKENKKRQDLEREMRKLEGDLGLAKETISDLENEKAQQEERLKKIEN